MQYEKSAAWKEWTPKKCNMEIEVQIWKECNKINMKKVKVEKSAAQRKHEKWKKQWKIKRVRYEKSAAWKECNMKKVQY